MMKQQYTKNEQEEEAVYEKAVEFSYGRVEQEEAVESHEF